MLIVVSFYFNFIFQKIVLEIISNSIDSDLDVSLSNINAGDKPFTTLSRLYACENGTNIYKIFSRQKLTNQVLT